MNLKLSIPSFEDIVLSTFSLCSLKALHVQLISVYVEAEMDSSMSASSTPSMTTSISCIQEIEHGSRSPVKFSTSTQPQVNKSLAFVPCRKHEMATRGCHFSLFNFFLSNSFLN